MKTMRTALGIDPGRSKCGLALVREDGMIIYKEIVNTELFGQKVFNTVREWKPDIILLGKGTGSKQAAAQISVSMPDINLIYVDERFSSEAARSRFLLENPARGLHRLIPASLRFPDRAYDDYVAVILCERFFENERA